jgi:beta-galactosidase
MKSIYTLSLFLLFSVFLPAQDFERFFPAKDLTTVGVYYYPEHWDTTQWERDIKKIADMGFEFTHFAEFAWAQLEPEEGRYDFKWIDRAVQLADKYNLRVIMCTSTATPPVWLTRKYPEILETLENGSQYDHGARQHASFSSEIYRSYSLKMVAELAQHYGKDKRIMGWQIDNEPRIFYDFGNDAHKRFRHWLKTKYKTIDALNVAWGTNFWSATYSDFDQINIPKQNQWGMNYHQRLDHARFIDQETASFLDEQAKVIRQYSTHEQWITSNYIPRYDVGYIGMSNELDFDTYTRYMVYGGDPGIGPRGYRVGDYSRIPFSNDFFRSTKGMYGVMELQPGQVNWGSINSQPLPGAVRLWLWHVFAGGSKFTCTYRFRAPLYGYEQYHYGIVSYDGITPTPGGLEFSQFIKEVELLRENYDSKTTLPEDYEKRKTAILFNADNVMAINMNKQTKEWDTYNHFNAYYKALKSVGAPVDFIRDSSNFYRYSILIAPAYQQIDNEMILKLTRYAESGGNLVLTCRTGHQNRLGHLWEAPFAQPIYDLIGAEIQSYDLPMPQSPNWVTFEATDYSWTSWGELLKPRAGTDVWATYKGDFYEGIPAIISRKIGKGSVTYIGVDSKDGKLEKAVLKRLFMQLEIPIENYPEGIMVDYRDGFGIAVSYTDTPYELQLKKGSKLLIGGTTLKTADVTVWKE